MMICLFSTQGHLEKPRITRLFEVPLDYRFVKGVINQRVTINTMEVFIHQAPMPYRVSVFLGAIKPCYLLLLMAARAPNNNPQDR